MTDYESEVKRLEDELSTFSSRTSNAPHILSPDRGTVAFLHSLAFRHATLTGRLQGLRSLDESLDRAILPARQASDLWLLKAQVALKRHRFNDAETALSAESNLRACPLASLLLSDVDQQRGRYAMARVRVEAVLAQETTWDALARLAYLASLMGDIRSADDLYAAAEDELSAKEMQTFAWVAVQRGWMHFQRGDHDRAASHYRRAAGAYSGYWLVSERQAELIGSQGRFAEASGIYERLYRDIPRPEWAHAIGDLQALAGDLQAAQRWKLRACASYLESTRSGEVYYFHCLSDLYSEFPGRESEAIEWAHRDLELRNNFATQGAVAWAYYRCDRLREAVDCIAMALASSIVSERLYLQAACIYAAVGQMQLAGHYMRLARAINPNPPRAKIAVPCIRARPAA